VDAPIGLPIDAEPAALRHEMSFRRRRPVVTAFFIVRRPATGACLPAGACRCRRAPGTTMRESFLRDFDPAAGRLDAIPKRPPRISPATARAARSKALTRRASTATPPPSHLGFGENGGFRL